MESNKIVIAFMTKAKFLINHTKSKIGNEYKGVSIAYKYLEPGSSNLTSTATDVDVLLADPNISSEAFQSIPNNVKWVQFTWAGIDSLTKQFNADQLKAFKPKFSVTRFGKGFNKGMAEYVVAQVISTERNFKLAYEKQAQHEWIMYTENSLHNYRTFSSLTVGVLGAGSIGMDVASHLKAMGAKVVAVKRTIPDEDHSFPVDKFYSGDQLDEFLSSCDYFCNVLPHTPDTVDLLSGDRLKACCKRQAGFINIGRGSVIDETSLVHALKSGWLRAAVLDVFKEEPLRKDSPLWDISNCTVTPHISGSCYDEFSGNVFVDNLTRFIDKQPLLYQFDWERMY